MVTVGGVASNGVSFTVTANTLTIASSNPTSGASVTVSPNDNAGQGNGTTQFTGYQGLTDSSKVVAIVVDGIPLDALAAELGLRRNAIYKVIFDARRKIRRALVANGYLDESALERR